VKLPVQFVDYLDICRASRDSPRLEQRQATSSVLRHLKKYERCLILFTVDGFTQRSSCALFANGRPAMHVSSALFYNDAVFIYLLCPVRDHLSLRMPFTALIRKSETFHVSFVQVSFTDASRRET
jgi:hypothetical protein